jgi:hypothetical protein
LSDIDEKIPLTRKVKTKKPKVSKEIDLQKNLVSMENQATLIAEKQKACHAIFMKMKQSKKEVDATIAECKSIDLKISAKLGSNEKSLLKLQTAVM